MLDAREPTKVVVMRVEVNISAGSNESPSWWRLPATHFRLLCRETTGREKTCESFYPVGYVYYDADAKSVKAVFGPEDVDGKVEPAKLILERPMLSGVYGNDRYGTGKVPQDKINMMIDWIYVLPKNAAPEALFFRRVDAVKTPVVSGTFNPSALREKMLTTPSPEELQTKRGRRGR
jgi:hypothetical protein